MVLRDNKTNNKGDASSGARLISKIVWSYNNLQGANWTGHSPELVVDQEEDSNPEVE